MTGHFLASVNIDYIVSRKTSVKNYTAYLDEDYNEFKSVMIPELDDARKKASKVALEDKYFATLCNH
jgi:hypothetical protein